MREEEQQAGPGPRARRSSPLGRSAGLENRRPEADRHFSVHRLAKGSAKPRRTRGAGHQRQRPVLPRLGNSLPRGKRRIARRSPPPARARTQSPSSTSTSGVSVRAKGLCVDAPAVAIAGDDESPSAGRGTGDAPSPDRNGRNACGELSHRGEPARSDRSSSPASRPARARSKCPTAARSATWRDRRESPRTPGRDCLRRTGRVPVRHS